MEFHFEGLKDPIVIPDGYTFAFHDGVERFLLEHKDARTLMEWMRLVGFITGDDTLVDRIKDVELQDPDADTYEAMKDHVFKVIAKSNENKSVGDAAVNEVEGSEPEPPLAEASPEKSPEKND